MALIYRTRQLCTEGTGKSCSLVLGEGLDARGLTPLVFDDDIGMMSVGDELLADYPPAIEGIDCNKGMAEIIKAAFLDIFATMRRRVHFSMS